MQDRSVSTATIVSTFSSYRELTACLSVLGLGSDRVRLSLPRARLYSLHAEEYRCTWSDLSFLSVLQRVALDLPLAVALPASSDVLGFFLEHEDEIQHVFQINAIFSGFIM